MTSKSVGIGGEALRLLGSAELDAAAIWDRYPVRIANAGKRVLLEAAGGRARRPSGIVRVARYAPAAVPETLVARPLELRPVASVYTYDAPSRQRSGPAPQAASRTTWHVNFANAHLFCAYGGAAFAQDELQVAEHPVLGSVLEALVAEKREGLLPLTVECGGPTPIVIRGAERWCAIDTYPDLAAPHGIYGRRFRTSPPEALRQAVTPLDGSSRTNLIAMEAPVGAGHYRADQIRFIYETAWTGFAAARAESPAGDEVTVHTGHWGTGAYGGNRVLMAALQIFAARQAGVDVLAYHSLDDDGAEAVREAAPLASLLAEQRLLSRALDEVFQRRFAWGTSDGS